MIGETMQRPDYSFDEFSRHFDELHSSGRFRGGSMEANVLVVNEYLKELPLTEEERLYKVQRFILIMMYISHNLNALDKSDYAVFGSSRVGALVSEHVFRAVHEFYTSGDLTSLRSDPTPEEMMKRADKYRKPVESDASPRS